jgi:hypothetical protein
VRGRGIILLAFPSSPPAGCNTGQGAEHNNARTDWLQGIIQAQATQLFGLDDSWAVELSLPGMCWRTAGAHALTTRMGQTHSLLHHHTVADSAYLVHTYLGQLHSACGYVATVLSHLHTALPGPCSPEPTQGVQRCESCTYLLLALPLDMVMQGTRTSMQRCVQHGTASTTACTVLITPLQCLPPGLHQQHVGKPAFTSPSSVAVGHLTHLCCRVAVVDVACCLQDRQFAGRGAGVTATCHGMTCRREPKTAQQCYARIAMPALQCLFGLSLPSR